MCSGTSIAHAGRRCTSRSRSRLYGIEMFGQVMHERRTALQLRLVDLESDYGIKRSQISRIEDGKTQICLIGIFQIAEGLDMTPSELIAEVHRRIVSDNTR